MCVKGIQMANENKGNKVVKPVASGAVNHGMEVPRAAILVDSTFNVRRKVDEGAIKALVADIKMRGLLNPVTVQHGDKAGTFKLVAGFTRMAALDSLGWQVVPVTVLSDTSKDAGIFANLAENVARESIPTFDLAVKLADIKSRFKMSANDIAARLAAGDDEGSGKRLSKQHVNNLVNLVTNLHPTLLKMWENGKVTLPQLLKVVSKPQDSQIQELADVANLKVTDITGEPSKTGEGADKAPGAGAEDSAPRISKPGESMIKVALAAVENTKVKMTENEKDALLAALAFVLGKVENLVLGSRVIFAPGAYKAAQKVAVKEAKEKAAQGAAVPAP